MSLSKSGAMHALPGRGEPEVISMTSRTCEEGGRWARWLRIPAHQQDAHAKWPKLQRSLRLRLFPQAVPDAANRLDQVSRAAGFLDLVPKRFHVHVDRSLEHDRTFADGRVHQLMAVEGA